MFRIFKYIGCANINKFSQTVFIKVKVVHMFEKATRGMSIYAKIAYGFLTSMAIVVPFAAGSQYYPIPQTYSQFGLYKVSAIFVLSVCAFFFVALDIFLGEHKIRWHSLMWPALIYLAFTTVSYAFSIDKNISFLGDYDRYAGLIPTAAAILMLFLALQLIRSNNGMRFFMMLFVVGSILLAAYGLAQSLGIETAKFANADIMGRRSFSLYGNPNLYAGYLCFAVFFSGGLLFSEKRAGWRVVYWIALIMNLAVTLTSMTRSVWLAVIVVAPLFILLTIRQKAKLCMGDKITIGTGLLAGISFVALTFTRKTADLNVASRLSSMFSTEGSSGTRIEMWKSALSIIKEYPLFGSGPDTFELTGMTHLTNRYLSLVGLGEVPNNAHCLPLQLAATIGITGMLAYYAVFLYAVVASWKYAWENDGQGQASAKILYGAVLCATCAFMIHSLVSIADIGVQPFYWIGLAYLVVPRSKNINLKGICTILPLFVAVPLLVAGLVLPMRLISADHNFRLALSEKQGSSAQVELFRRAMQENGFEADYAAKYIDSLGGSYIARVQSLQKTDAIKLMSAVDEVYNKFPHRIDIQSVTSYYYTAMAMVFQTDDFFKAAIEQDKEIIKESPMQLSVIGDLASLYKATGNQAQAEKLHQFILRTGPETKMKQESLSLYDSVKLRQK